MWCVSCALRCVTTCKRAMPNEKPTMLTYLCEECGEECVEERFHDQRHAPTTCFICGAVAYYDETQEEGK